MRQLGMILTALSVYGASCAYAQPVTVVNVPLIRDDLLDYPIDWRGTSRLVELLTAAWPLGQVHINYQYGIPFERSIRALETNDQGAYCVPFMRQTADRAQIMQFSRPLVASRPVAILHRADDNRPAEKANLKDLFTDRHLILAIRKGSRFGEEIDSLLQSYPPKKALLATASAVPPHEFLCNGRADYRLVDSRTGISVANCANGTPLTTTIYPDAPMIAAEALGCSFATPKFLIDAIDAQLDAATSTATSSASTSPGTVPLAN